MSPIQAAPTSLSGIARHLGPGLIISASIVGSGELIVTTKLGADVGFSLLWFIIFGCILKVFVQVELGRFALSRGITTLEALNMVPGPRVIVSWILWLWLAMYVALVFQVAGIVGGVAKIFALGGATLPENAWAIIVSSTTAVLLVLGRYKLVEVTSTLMMVVFTLCTVFAVGALQWTPFAMKAAQISHGLSFQFPDSFTTAFAAFGVIGVGASELIYYPYWCLEKGYARYVGPNDGTSEWAFRAKGWIRVMTADALVSLVVYTTATVSFYLLGAAVLNGKSLSVTNSNLIETLSHMYKETLGPWGMWIYLAGAFAVLYSTVFVATASNARLAVDAVTLFSRFRYSGPEHREKAIKLACVILSIASCVVFLLFGAPISLVFVGAIAQGLMLPFLGYAALYFRYRETDEKLRPGAFWSLMLWTSAAAMAAVGIYQVLGQFLKR